MPRLWTYIRTNERNVQHYGSSRGRLTPFSSHKPRQPINVENSPSAEDNVPLKGKYKELQDDKKRHDKEGLEMQILKTETYTVTCQMKQKPDVA